jgi:hypothetical protein
VLAFGLFTGPSLIYRISLELARKFNSREADAGSASVGPVSGKNFASSSVDWQIGWHADGQNFASGQRNPVFPGFFDWQIDWQIGWQICQLTNLLLTGPAPRPTLEQHDEQPPCAYKGTRRLGGTP